MNDAVHDRLFDSARAFDSPVTVGLTLAVAAALVGGLLIVELLGRGGRIGAAQFDELRKRMISWCVLAPAMILPVLLGAAWTILAVGLLGLLCYREFALATGFFRHRLLSFIVALGIVLLTFAALDHWYHFFLALPSLTIVTLAAFAILPDQPRGYLQRVALGTFGYLFFGVCLLHLAYMANDPGYRPIILMLLIAVELNDVFAYIAGKSFGRRKLCPATSPGKTVGGSVGAFACTTLLVALLGAIVFHGTPVAHPLRLIGLGLLVSVAGQLGDLMLSSIKRDLGIKDMGVVIPGHGGLLDRFDSLILVAPAAFHYLAYLDGLRLSPLTRILSGV
ncbi:MAG TPA: phosphatidate cytidylyltransferase [Candidatus Sumerlaeota bacterium]|nr:phosphatidate cytidylyltransferase [Candidatus Sumerlaeota bacterium]HOR27415.1 phosphatidate cytidylyltransferase [Candidatus Sumerlaeota bacterium]HPK03303.1 phosphatidate cytidylyltransferase [Candidatus Sumerlaeota bacterium]